MVFSGGAGDDEVAEGLEGGAGGDVGQLGQQGRGPADPGSHRLPGLLERGGLAQQPQGLDVEFGVGQVVQGMDVVRAILALPTTGVARDPAMQGQILDPPVRIVSMRREG